MTLLLALNPTSSIQVPCGRGVSVVYKLVKCTMIPEVVSELASFADIYGARDELDA